MSSQQCFWFLTSCRVGTVMATAHCCGLDPCSRSRGAAQQRQAGLHPLSSAPWLCHHYSSSYGPPDHVTGQTRSRLAVGIIITLKLTQNRVSPKLTFSYWLHTAKEDSLWLTCRQSIGVVWSDTI